MSLLLHLVLSTATIYHHGGDFIIKFLHHSRNILNTSEFLINGSVSLVHEIPKRGVIDLVEHQEEKLNNNDND